MLVYVAGPYSADSEDDRIANVERACVAGDRILNLGHWPFIPHLTHYFDEWRYGLFNKRHDAETYMQWDFAILRRCDGLLWLAPSPGADRELALARELGLPVWMAVDEIPRA